MAFPIIRNSKYKMKDLNIVFRHNERRNTNYSNDNIDKTKSIYNYSLKNCNMPYSKKFKEIKSMYDLKGQMKVTNNVACEFLITASPEFFIEIGPEETKRYFESAYKFVCNFKGLGQENIISARVHMDESNPHMHLVYIPVVHSKDKIGNEINKISCSEFWKGKNSYTNLQDNYHKYLTRCGFNLERSKNVENTHLAIKDLKVVTNFEEQQFLKKSNPHHYEVEIFSDDIAEIKEHYKRVIRKCNTLSEQYTKIKSINETNQKSLDDLTHKCSTLERKCTRLQKENTNLRGYIQNTFEAVSKLIGWSINQLKGLVYDHILTKKSKEVEKDIEEELEEELTNNDLLKEYNLNNLIDTKDDPNFKIRKV